MTFTEADIARCEQAIRDRVAEINPFSVNVYREGAIAVLEELAARPLSATRSADSEQ